MAAARAVDDGGAGAVAWVGCEKISRGGGSGGAAGSSDWPAVVAEADSVVGPSWRFGVSMGDAAVDLSKLFSSRAGGSGGGTLFSTTAKAEAPASGTEDSLAGSGFRAGLCIAGAGASATFLVRAVD